VATVRRIAAMLDLDQARFVAGTSYCEQILGSVPQLPYQHQLARLGLLPFAINSFINN
jgi:hypothetical protein